MRAILQRVKQASVSVNQQTISQIDKGLLILIGITKDDTVTDIDYMVKKILNIRLFEDEEGLGWKRSVKDLNLEILSVSQFTLYAETRKGSKPDFHKALKAPESKVFYHDFLEKLKMSYQADKIKDGAFGEMMDVALVNDGPVTIQLDSRKFEYKTDSTDQ